MNSIASLLGIAAATVLLTSFDAVAAQDSARSRHPVTHHRSSGMQPRQLGGSAAGTVGAGPSVPASGPFYDPSIHQSAGGRDSRGFPKYCTGGKC
jgi:hypothetical protein